MHRPNLVFEIGLFNLEMVQQVCFKRIRIGYNFFPVVLPRFFTEELAPLQNTYVATIAIDGRQN